MDSSRCRRYSRLPPPKRRRLSSSCTTTKGSTNGLLSGGARNGLCGCIFKGLRACTTTKTDKTGVDLLKLTHTSSMPVPLSSRFSDLTDDVLLDILLRLPAKSLHRFKSVSKRWFSLISAPSFARSHIIRRFSNERKALLPDDDPAARDVSKIVFFKIHTSSPGSVGQVFGLPLLHDDMNKVSSSMSGLLPPLSFDFIQSLRPDKYDHHSGLTPKGMTERVLVDMDLKGNCTGLVLLQAVFQDRTDVIPYDDNLRYNVYYVCNPITKHWVELPSISTLGFIGFTCYYVQQGEGEEDEKMTRIWVDTASSANDIKQIANYDPNRIEYTVISINREEQDDVFVIRVFSSTAETAEWRIFRVPFPCGFEWNNTYESKKVLFSNGKFHWTGGTCIVAYDPFNKPDECGIISLPPMDPPIIDSTYMFIATYEGRIRVGTPLWTKRFSVWELADYANKVWVKKSEVNVDFNGLVYIQSFVGGAAPGDKAYVVADKPSNTIMVFDLKNASLQHVYTYPIKEDDYYYYSHFFMLYSESYISLRWPTAVPQLQRK